ncbi:hypothetical protein K461DRAFT_276343 [Myriangium duriaei CBS 260.36]|uniref:Protein SQS1 n=1 Tax=Myriangium duriaei CBS 260.36 TaxID=1168546 RepID=A0A9P4J8N7_9PEZI|nr:hypothetical protein K461DRAFT_276343 [Myriangium duriaei CBS 260.36]
MAKNHKAKGNQQKPHKRKSLRGNFSRESSGPPTPHFSLRDEVLNTERHHSHWSPSSQLRHQAISFVSAGCIQPLEEPKVDQPPNLSAKAADDAVENDLEGNEGALAQMNIQSPMDASPSPEINITMDMDTPQSSVTPAQQSARQSAQRHASMSPNTAAHSAGPDMTISLEGPVADSVDFFVVDSVGDKSLKPKVDAPPPVARDVSPSLPSDSEDDVILFRGRREPVVVRDDPMVALETRSKPASKPLKAPIPDTTPSRTSKRRNSKTHKRSRPGKLANSRKAKHQIPHDDDDEIDEEVYLDYIANMSGDEELFKMQRGMTDDEWASSVFDESEVIGQVEFAYSDTEHEKVADDSQRVVKESARHEPSGSPNDPSKSVEGFLQRDLLDIMRDGTRGVDWEEESSDGDGDEVDDDGTSDPGDDSDLESDLEYTAQERWEDETDLRQRQIDALTDEEIARILAKQEDLGMGSDEILLLDDSGFGDLSRAQAGLDAILADPAHPNRRKPKKGKRSDHFPSASLMADVLEQDPYGGFDVMDFDRPSLRNNTKGQKGRKSAGPMPEELLDLSDSDLIDDLQSAWANDRAKKAAKKAEREELRSQGLLGRANKFKQPNLAIKFSDGMSLDELRGELEMFLADPGMSSKAFPPMDKKERKLLHEIAHVLELTSTSRGSGKNRFTVLSKRARTPGWDEMRWDRVQRIASRGFLRGSGKGKAGRGTGPPARAGRGGGFSKAATGYMNGEVVGAAAPEIAATSFGHKLMLKMGWEKGMALGKGGEGMLVPVEARVKSGRGGLG